MLATAVTALSCADTPTPPESPVVLNANATLAVNTVLGDVDLRMHEALESTNARARFRDAIAKLNTSLAVGRMDEAGRNLRDAREALSQAASMDTDGSGDADRTAILLALDVTTLEISNARRGAAGGLR
ncbi:MAG: hypothetical protein AABZ80_05885 [Gemmatimonadota bacterium]